MPLLTKMIIIFLFTDIFITSINAAEKTLNSDIFTVCETSHSNNQNFLEKEHRYYEFLLLKLPKLIESMPYYNDIKGDLQNSISNFVSTKSVKIKKLRLRI